MTAKQLLKFIDEIKQVEEVDYIVDDLKFQRDNLCIQLECEGDKKRCKLLRKEYNDLSEKMEAIEMMKFQRILFYKLAGF